MLVFALRRAGRRRVWSWPRVQAQASYVAGFPVPFCSDPAGAPALPAPSPAVRVLSSGLRIYEAIGHTQVSGELFAIDPPTPAQSFWLERALTEALAFDRSAAQINRRGTPRHAQVVAVTPGYRARPETWSETRRGGRSGAIGSGLFWRSALNRGRTARGDTRTRHSASRATLCGRCGGL